MASLDTERLSLAFQSRPDLVEQIRAAAAKSPAHTPLFNSIAGYVYEQVHGGGEPAHKRRRVEAEGEANPHSHSALPARQGTAAATASQNGSTGSGGGGRGETDLLGAAAAETVLLEVKDISVSIPQRKKYDLCFTKNYLYARAANTTTPVPGIVYAWTDFEYVFYLPVPEKTQVQYNYILFPRHAALASLSKPTPAAAAAAPTTPPPPAAEPLVFTVPATAPKPGQVGGPSAGLAAAVSDSYTTLFHWAIEGQLRSAENVHLARQRTIIVAADPNVFHSAARQPFRPAEKAVHVRAFRGSKDGYLFFLPTGILWGFKKPLLFLPLDRIVAVSYTNVLQRTFNIVVEVDVGAGTGAGTGADDNEEIEFGMLDQEDYGGISETYVQRHNLQDRSMAERRKAKRELAENARGDKTANGEGGADSGVAGANGDGAPDDGLTELQRAEQQLQDEEDEDEEDYDPGSDGDSDGSGSSDEEGTEDGEEGDGEGDEGDEDDDDEEGEKGDEE